VTREAVRLAVLLQLRRIDQLEVREAEVLHRSGDGADVAGCLRLDDDHDRLAAGLRVGVGVGSGVGVGAGVGRVLGAVGFVALVDSAHRFDG